jgi:hypothetical protein
VQSHHLLSDERVDILSSFDLILAHSLTFALFLAACFAGKPTAFNKTHRDQLSGGFGGVVPIHGVNPAKSPLPAELARFLDYLPPHQSHDQPLTYHL